MVVAEVEASSGASLNLAEELSDALVDRLQGGEAIGPEGGWSERELTQALASGWIEVTLGTSILRSSTAAVAGISSICSWRTLRT